MKKWRLRENLPNVTEGLHKVLADERCATVRRRNGQFKGATPALSRRLAAGHCATATAASVAGLAARAAAAGRAGTAAVGAAAAVLEVEEAFLRVEGGRRRIVVLILVVERVHLVYVLLIVATLVAVSVDHAVPGRAESQAHNAILICYRQDGFGILPVLGTHRNLLK